MEAGGSSSSSSSKGNNNNNLLDQRKVRPGKDQALNCPRCNSTNTKFCYYNNYSLSQPRYFCKSCRRYWTEGGSLRNVPVGGGSRKNKRSSSSSSVSAPSSSSSADKKINGSDQNPKIIHHVHHQDLNLAIFPPNTNQLPVPASFMAPAPPNAGGIFNAGGGGGGFGLNEMKPSLSFSLEGFESGGGGGGGYGDLHLHLHHNHHQDQDQTAVMFPIEDLKQSNGAAEFQQNRGGNHSGGGYWNGMLGGGSW